MRVLIIVDKFGTAIDRHARAMIRENSPIDVKIISYHPKRPSDQEKKIFEQEARKSTILDFRYWKSAMKIAEDFPELFQKTKILTHHNPYDLDKLKFSAIFDANVVMNRTQKDTFKRIHGQYPYHFRHVVPMTDESDFYFNYLQNKQFNKHFKPLMVANRIEGKKGILPVAEACKRLGLQLQLVGNISDRIYFNKVMATESVLFHMNISDIQLREMYHESDILICNSDENFESGTMPILEAIACGTPVLTREVGMVPDLSPDTVLMRSGYPEDVESIVQDLARAMESPNMLERIRSQAYRNIVNRDTRYSFDWYYRLYMDMIYPDKEMVSIVIPCKSDIRKGVKALLSSLNQSYKKIEVIFVYEGNDVSDIVKGIRKMTDIPVKCIHRDMTDEYTLAELRNQGVLAADGEILVFNDDRISMDYYAVERFVANSRESLWLFGNKGADKSSFVENFSSVRRRDIIRIGLFPTVIRNWGGMTSELNQRLHANGMKTKFVNTAKSKPHSKSSSRTTQRQELVRAKYTLYRLWDSSRK